MNPTGETLDAVFITIRCQTLFYCGYRAICRINFIWPYHGLTIRGGRFPFSHSPIQYCANGTYQLTHYLVTIWFYGSILLFSPRAM